MRVRSPRSVGLLAAMTVALGLGTVSGCDSQQDADSGTGSLAQRARQVAAAWDGSAAAATWRAGYHPMGEVTQLPRGGLRSPADQRAYQDRSFVLRAELPTTRPPDGRVTWAKGGSLTRPLVAAADSYRPLGDVPADTEPHLTVTGAKLGEMHVTTSRGPATVPAWLFDLEGYDSPLKRPAVRPSKLPRPPIERARDLPGHPLDGLLRVSADGRSVTVIAAHGACDDGPTVDVHETSGSVVLAATVKNRKTQGLCTKQLKFQQVTVHLTHPLNPRPLLDAHTGQPPPDQPPHGPALSRT